MKNLLRTTTVLAAFGLLSATPCLLGAASPNLVGYQGVLRDGGGTPLTGTFTVSFSIYPTPVGGAIVWTEAQMVTTDANGSFNILLGSNTALDESVFSGEVRYLGVTVNPDPEMTPRQRLVSVPYAHRAGTVDSASGGTIVGNVVITSGVGSQLEVRKGGGVPGVTLNGGVGGGGATLSMTNDVGSASITMDADQSGDVAVQIPGGAISAIECLNEPGVGYAIDSNVTALNSTVQTLISRSITAPSSGYVLAIGSAQVKITHTNMLADTTLIGVTPSAGSFGSGDGLMIALDPALPSGVSIFPLTDCKLFPVTSGAHTFYLVADELRGNTSVEQRQLSLAFFPTAYGTVAVAASPGEDVPLQGRSQSLEEEQSAATVFNVARLEQELAIVRDRAEQTTRQLAEVREMLREKQPVSPVVNPEN